MNASETTVIVRQAVDELADWFGEPNPWQHIFRLLENHDDDWVAWWWRQNKDSDISTWRTLRAKVVEIRLRT